MALKQILDGRKLANNIVDDLHEKIIKLNARKPKLIVLQVGNDSASNSYIKQKRIMSLTAGIEFELIKLPVEISEAELIKHIDLLNNNDDIDGYLVQLPLPKHISPRNIVGLISPSKDVDGFHPNNIGKLFYQDYHLAPCTPLGIMLLLENYEIDVLGSNVTIVGASTIVGKPLSIMLSNAGATVTLCHKHTRNLSKVIANSDIIISATGNTKAIDASDIKSGSIIIDVGINFDQNGKMIGDIINNNQAIKQAKFYTPVPGGVGPMTVAALLINTWNAYLLNMNAK